MKAIHAVECLTLLLAGRAKNRVMYSFSVSEIHTMNVCVLLVYTYCWCEHTIDVCVLLV